MHDIILHELLINLHNLSGIKDNISDEADWISYIESKTVSHNNNNNNSGSNDELTVQTEKGHKMIQTHSKFHQQILEMFYLRKTQDFLSKYTI